MTLTSFPRSHQHFECQILIKKKKLICTLSFEPNDRFFMCCIKMSLVCTLSPEPIGGFWPNFHRITETWEKSLDFADLGLIFKVTPALCTLSPEQFCGFWANLHRNTTDTLTSFSRSYQHFECQILTKKACLHPISWTKWWILAKLFVLYYWDN